MCNKLFVCLFVFVSCMTMIKTFSGFPGAPSVLPHVIVVLVLFCLDPAAAFQSKLGAEFQRVVGFGFDRVELCEQLLDRRLNASDTFQTWRQVLEEFDGEDVMHLK